MPTPTWLLTFVGVVACGRSTNVDVDASAAGARTQRVSERAGHASPLPEEQHSPYWSAELASGRWTPIEWGQKPDHDLARGVLRHGHVVALTQAEHAALRGADLLSVSLRTPPRRLP